VIGYPSGQDGAILHAWDFGFVFMDLNFVLVLKHAKKRNWPTSSHLDLTLGLPITHIYETNRFHVAMNPFSNLFCIKGPLSQ